MWAGIWACCKINTDLLNNPLQKPIPINPFQSIGSADFVVQIFACVILCVSVPKGLYLR